jgi:hypothetical protein
LSDFEDMSLAAELQAAEVKICPTCIGLRLGIELLIGTDEDPREAPDMVVMPLLVRWQQHKDQAHPAFSAYLRRTS